MTDKADYCECQGPEYKGCLLLANNLYACHKKDGTLDNTKACLGERQIGTDGFQGWSKGCSNLSYTDLKDRVTKWCTKLYQDGIYDYKQYQDCLQNLELGTVSYYKRSDDESVDDDKDVTRVYGYYQKGQEKIDNVSPAIPLIKDDFQKMTIYHSKYKGYLISDKDGNISIQSNPDISEEKEWQLIDLSQGKIFALRSKYGKFLVGTDKNEIVADRDNLTPWARWNLIKQNETFAFQSVDHKKYLTIQNDIPNLKDGWSEKNL